MNGLLAKLETLVDEVTELVREERKRRNNPFWPFGEQKPDLYGPRGTEISFFSSPQPKVE